MERNRVLIVEDEPGVAFFLKEGLKLMQGIDRVRVVHSGECALALMHQEPPDLLVVDLQLPGINGLDVVRMLRGQGDAFPVVLMTAYGSEKVEKMAREVGIAVILNKPFGLQIFVDQVFRLLQSQARLDRVEPDF